MSAERLGALPLGELHAEGVCAYCGSRGEIVYPLSEFEFSMTDLYRTVLPLTGAVAHVCISTAACERRRYNRKRFL